jgi:hypothetical protein
MNGDYFLKQFYQIDLCDADALCFVEVGTELLSIIYMSFGVRRPVSVRWWLS